MTRLSAQSAVTSFLDTDIFHVVVDPGATNLDKKITGANLKVQLFASPTLVTPTIAKVANLTSNGFVKTSSGDGTLSIDASVYITGASPTIVTPTIASFVNATHSHANAAGGGTLAHSVLTSLSADDHTQYALGAGRSGGQTLKGGTGSGDGLTLTSTNNATKGTIALDATLYVDGVNLRVGVGVSAPATKMHTVLTDSATNTVSNVSTIGHNTSGTPAAAYGTGISLQGQSDTTINRDMGRIRTYWVTPTDASRSARMVVSIFDTAERDVLYFEAFSGSGHVGINTLAVSAYSLDVNSNARLSGTDPTLFIYDTDANGKRFVMKMDKTNNMALLQTTYSSGGDFPIVFKVTNTEAFRLISGGHLQIGDAVNIALNTTTGTQLATVGGAAGQKLAFWGATPVVQPLFATGASHTVDQLITVLQTLGLVRQS